jgi:hypothetical protein
MLWGFVCGCGNNAAKHDMSVGNGSGHDMAMRVGDMAAPVGDMATPVIEDMAAPVIVDMAMTFDMAHPFTLSVGAATDVAPFAVRQSQGFKFGYADGVLGAVKGVYNGTSYYFMFGSGFSGTGTTCNTGTPKLAATPATQGVYTILGDGTDPTKISTAWCAALLSPEGGGFDGGTNGPYDRNYLGGGPVMRITSADGTKTGILTVVHTEFQWGPTCASAPCFYGTLGMGLSTDEGQSMQRLGQIIQPYPTRPAWIGLPTGPFSLSIGNGPFVVGDIDGNPIDPTTAVPTQSYFYVYFPDYHISASNNLQPGLAVARALMSDVIAAAFAGNSAAFPTLFKKYYNPNGTLATRDAFTEPGVGTDTVNNAQPSGNFTPVLTKAFSPSILYDVTVGQAILASTNTNAAGVRIIELRTSASLVSWPAMAAATVDESALATSTEVRYPSLIGERPSPAVGATAPYLFYSHEPVSVPTWPNTTLEARRVQITLQ